MNSEGKIYALLATARIANVPSVLSNLGAGIFLALLTSDGKISWPWALCLAAILFYVSGNFLNDWMDRSWDEKHRPERALPRRLFSSKSYLLTALSGFGFGLLLSSFYGLKVLLIAIALVAFILLYTKIHKQTSLSVLPMGLCRACLPLLGFFAIAPEAKTELLFPSFALFFYIIALSISARCETRNHLPKGKKLLARSLLLGASLIAAIPALQGNEPLAWAGLLPFVIWLMLAITQYAAPVSAHVSALLAGIPLIDWIRLLPLALIALSKECASPALEAHGIACLLLSPLCFILGRLLQKIAPAT